MPVTASNKKATEFLIRDRATGQFLSASSLAFEAIAVTNVPSIAQVFTDGIQAAKARDVLQAHYGSFDWRVVEREIYVTVPAVPFLLARKAA